MMDLSIILLLIMFKDVCQIAKDQTQNGHVLEEIFQQEQFVFQFVKTVSKLEAKHAIQEMLPDVSQTVQELI